MTPAGMQGQDAYRISRVIGNNFVCITDADGHEVILRGLGIGFKKQPGDLVPAQKIEKIYDLRDPEKSSRLMELLEAQVGAGELEALLQSHNQLPPLTVQRNPLAVSEADFRRELADAGVEATPHPWCRDSWLLQGSGSLEALPLFRRGGFYVQDPAARLAVTAAGL